MIKARAAQVETARDVLEIRSLVTALGESARGRLFDAADALGALSGDMTPVGRRPGAVACACRRTASGRPVLPRLPAPQIRSWVLRPSTSRLPVRLRPARGR
jgi:hypothetical protein